MHMYFALHLALCLYRDTYIHMQATLHVIVTHVGGNQLYIAIYVYRSQRIFDHIMYRA